MKPEMIESDRKFWSVPIVICSNVWENGYHIYEADSAAQALNMYHSELHNPEDIEYTGWMDQEYKYDEHDDLEEVEEMNNGTSIIQYLLKNEKKKQEKENPDDNP